MYNIFKGLFKKAPIEVVKTRTIEDVCTDDYCKMQMIDKVARNHITMKELFNITQEVKRSLNYSILDNGDKYIIDKFQDLVLYIAVDYRNLEKINKEQENKG